MWMIFATCREAREIFAFSLKMMILGSFLLHFVVEMSDGLEVRRGWKGDHCKKDEDCDNRRHLYCTGDDNTCDCQRVKGRIWIPWENACKVKEEAPCDHSGPQCVTNSSCMFGKCECDDQFLRNGYGFCELSFGNRCYKDADCANRYLLHCVRKSEQSSVSECKCYDDFDWDEDRRKCVSFAGGRCELDNSKDDQLECIKQSECIPNGPNSSPICKCKPGLTQTDRGTCEASIGSSCNLISGPQCNHEQFLLCKNGKCKCDFEGQLKFDETLQQCRIKAGETCHIHNYSDSPGNFRNSRGEIQYSCVQDAECKPLYPNSIRGNCTCKPGTDRTPDGSCSRYYKPYGQQCSTSIDCNKDKFLECVQDYNEGSHCDCPPNEMIFDGTQCRVLAGKRCTLNKRCDTFSYCEGEWCVCDQGYHIGSSGRCVPENKNVIRSTPSTSLAVVPQGHLVTRVSSVETSGSKTDTNGCENFDPSSLDYDRCVCHRSPESHFWYEHNRRCLARVGISCDTDSDCIPNAICDVHAKICQCSPVAHTTAKLLCIPSTDSQHSGDNRDCNIQSPQVGAAESHTSNLYYLIVLIALIVQTLAFDY